MKYVKTCWQRSGAAGTATSWDAYIHGACVAAFLKTDEGQIVVEHKHHIQVDGTVLQKEGELNEILLETPLRVKSQHPTTKPPNAHDLRPRRMRTLFGRRLHFELRAIQLPKTPRNGPVGAKMRRVWIVVFDDKPGRVANYEEVRLWRALPNPMRLVEKPEDVDEP